MKTKINCPVCNGCGMLEPPKKKSNSVIEQKIIIVKKLKENGYSVREIMKIMNYKSPQAVSYLLKKQN